MVFRVDFLAAVDNFVLQCEQHLKEKNGIGGTQPMEVWDRILDQCDDDDLQALQEPFGWPELQIGIVREAIAVAEALPGKPS